MAYSDYFIWNGDNSNTQHILVNKLPDISKPLQRVKTVSVEGRNGALHIADGTFENTIKTCECTLMDDTDIEDVVSWLKGSGTVTFSNEPTKFYKAFIINLIPFAKIVKGIRSFPIVFDCFPFKYLVDETSTPHSTPSSVFNLGNFPSEPIIALITPTISSGTGIVTITITPTGTMGKNLFNSATATTGYYIVSGGTLTANVAYVASDYISIIPNAYYVDTGNMGMAFYDVNKTYISYFNADSGTHISPSNAAYARYTFYLSNYLTGQVELGATSTAYEAYTVSPGATTQQQIFTIANTNGETVIIDSEIQDCYSSIASTNRNNKMTGDFPLLAVGNNTIRWSMAAGLSVPFIEILPNSRWL